MSITETRYQRAESSLMIQLLVWKLHAHPNETDDVLQDAVLWVHILIQIAAFGLIFPAGMVLGVGTQFCFSSQLQSANPSISPDRPLTLARSCPSRRHNRLDRGLLSWSCPQRSPIRAQHPRFLRHFSDAYAIRPSRDGHLPQVSPEQRNPCANTQVCRYHTWCRG